MKTFELKTYTRTILADLYTPVGAYMRLRDLYAQSALMESSDYHNADNSKSYIGIRPIGSFSVSHGIISCSYPDGTVEEVPVLAEGHHYVGDEAKNTVVNAMTNYLKHFKIEGDWAELCGLYGYTTFNAVRYFENIAVKDEVKESNDAPDMLYILYGEVIVFDHFNNTMTLVHLAQHGEEHGEEALDVLEKQLNRPNVQPYTFKAVGELTSTLTDEQHKQNIRKCVEHCKRGDVFQIVISRRFVQKYEGDDFKLYRALRSINPSPYLFYFDFGGFRLLGSSPETHNRIDGNLAYIDPIAGTTPRTNRVEEDKKNAEYLRNDPKENAEHVMLVDLARNDLSRNCSDVHVDFYKDMQFYSHVIHLVSRVAGTLANKDKAVQTFVDTFPAGTLSGAPKVRAMQIISELEPHNRGAYGGCIGFVGFNGDLNQAIVIRTFVSRNGELWLQAGSGIVAKSNEDYELAESNHKLGALMKAIKEAERL